MCSLVNREYPIEHMNRIHSSPCATLCLQISSPLTVVEAGDWCVNKDPRLSIHDDFVYQSTCKLVLSKVESGNRKKQKYLNEIFLCPDLTCVCWKLTKGMLSITWVK